MKRSRYLKRPDCAIYYEVSGSGPELAALAAKGRALRLPKAAHSVYFERPAEFNRLVDEFLKTT